MKAVPLLLGALVLSGCGSEGPAESEQPGWLAGHWIPVGEDTPFPLACESDAGVIFEADGQFHREGGSGRWSVEGDQLIETMTTVHDPDPETRIDGERLVSTIRRIDANRFRSIYADDEAVDYRRCPA